jgi:heme oxygenase
MTRLASATTFHEELKLRTADAHDKLEALPVSKSIMSPDVSLQDYARYLTLMHPVVADAEQNVTKLLEDVLDDLDSRRKLCSIEDDLRFLGITPTPADRIFDVDDQAFALGVMYVVEGSALGGRFILKNLEKSLGLSAEAGASYFAGYGNVTGSMWKRFVEQMSEFEKRTGSGDTIIAGAVHAFSAIENRLSSI